MPAVWPSVLLDVATNTVVYVVYDIPLTRVVKMERRIRYYVRKQLKESE